ncbi:MAG: response regulator [Synergistaceae bacterium]|jgi:putative two-component system response regulator|nr:response regulator [Synergistaceae bacterium]
MLNESDEKKKVILAVDDAQTNLQIIQSTLKDTFELRLAKSGGMGLTVLDRIVPDLILLDIEMPDMSGFDCIEAFRAKPQLKDIPIIFVTSHASKKFVMEAHEKGARDYIVRPFDPALLRSKVHKALGFQNGSNVKDHGQ